MRHGTVKIIDFDYCSACTSFCIRKGHYKKHVRIVDACSEAGDNYCSYFWNGLEPEMSMCVRGARLMWDQPGGGWWKEK